MTTWPRTRLLAVILAAALLAAAVTLPGLLHARHPGPALPLRPIGEMALPGDSSRFDYESLDPGRGLLFIAHLGASQVIETDVRTSRVVRVIPGLAQVHGVLAVPALHRLYATATGDNQMVTKAELARFLGETLRLELNAAKTLITHARTQRARFLGYHVTVQHSSTKLTSGRRAVNGTIALRVPPDVVTAKCAPYRRQGKPWHRPRLQNLDDYDIVRVYGAEYRGIVNYYQLAQDVWKLGRLRWNALTSMLKTLAAKHESTVTTMAARHKAAISTADGPRTCFEARKRREGKPDLVARFGEIPLKRGRRAVINDPAPVPVPAPRKELIHRLRARRCELCEHGATVTVHQVARLADLGRPGPGQPAWAALMARMRRKTLIVCADCHDHIHANPVAHAA